VIPLKLLLSVLFLLLNAFFVAHEFVIVKVRKTQVAEWMRKGLPGVWFVQHALQHMNDYLSANQLGITIASLGLGWLGEPAVAALLHPWFVATGLESPQVVHGFSFGVAFALISSFHIVVGEIAPKNLAIRIPEKLIFWVAPPMFVFYVLFYPACKCLNFLSDHLLAKLGFPTHVKEGLTYTRDELKMILEASGRQGDLSEDEARWLRRIFRFGQTLVREVMIPRTEMVAVSVSDPVERIVDKAVEEGFSRLPVYQDHYDNIVGILYVKDLLNIWRDRNLIIIQDTMRPPWFVPETKKVSELLREFQKGRHHMAIVVDEFGGTAGLVTLEDLIEEIVGDIRDEYDTAEDAAVAPQSDGSLLVSGRAEVHQLQEQWGWPPEADGETASIGGYIAHRIGRVPQKGEVLTIDGITVTVLEADRRRVHKVRLEKTGKVG